MANTVDLSDIPGVQAEEWRDMHPRQRMDTLQEVENRLAKAQGRPPRRVLSKVYNDNDPYIGGHHELTDQETIYYNANFLHSESPVAAVHAVSHEGRHAYQQHCILNPEQHPEVSEAQRNEWREDSKPGNYIFPDQDFEAYKRQPVEADADRFADTVVQETYKDRQLSLGSPEPVRNAEAQREQRKAYWRGKAHSSREERRSPVAAGKDEPEHDYEK